MLPYFGESWIAETPACSNELPCLNVSNTNDEVLPGARARYPPTDLCPPDILRDA
jgi:hypothetical protein